MTAPTGGSVSVGANGELTYTGRAGFSGSDSFTYTVADDQGYVSNVATVRVTVAASPSAPNNPPTSSGGGGRGGGGSMLFAQLCLLSLLAGLSRRRSGARMR